MDYLPILAQTAQTTTQAAEAEPTVVPMDYFWQQIIALNWFEAVIAISFGAIYLLYGWRIFKIIVAISFGLLGLHIGLEIGERADNVLWGGLIGLAVMVAISLPLMRWAVSILGAVAGGIFTGAIWYAFELPEKYIIAGALVGIVAGGMISFIVFRVSVMLFTSLQGAALIIAGALALMHLYVQQSEDTMQVHRLFFEQRWFLPLLLLAPTAVGIILQNKLVKDSVKWEL